MMRLTDMQQQAIRLSIRNNFGQEARVLLFGSRVDDRKRGGDIDLVVFAPGSPEALFLARMKALTDIQLLIGERKIDLVTANSEDDTRPVIREAIAHGIAL